MLLDEAKAYNTVSVSLLISKLERLGLSKYNLLSYLKKRRYCVKTVTYSVRQGSILGPTLLLVYMWLECLHTQMLLP